MRRQSSQKGPLSYLPRTSAIRLAAAIAIAATMACLPTRMLGQNATLTDDAQTSVRSPGRNFGTAPSLRVMGGRDRVFVKFSLPENLPPGTVGAHVGKATLKLFVNTVNSPGPLGAATVIGPWSEATITDATAPGVGPMIGFFNILPTQHDQWLTLDVTTVVRGWVDNAASNQGLVLFAAPGGADLSFDSKESTSTSHQAQLEIVLNHAATADNATNAATATNATELGGVPAGNFVKTGDPVLTGARTPLPGSPDYIQNTTTQQTADFNISGTGTLGSADVGLPRSLAQPNVRLNIHGSGVQTEARIQDDNERAVLSLDSTIGGQRRVYTVENGIFGNPGLFGIYDRTAGQLRFNIDPTGKANIPGNLDIGLATAAEPNPNDNVKLRVHGGPNANGTGGGLTEAKIQSDNERTILSLDSTMGGQRYIYTIENGVFGQPGLFAIYDRVNANVRFQIDPTGAVTIPQNLNVGQTLNANTLSLNIVDAKQQFTFGGNPFIRSDDSARNLFVGLGSGTANLSQKGILNTFVGSFAGAHNDIGHENSFFGAFAGFTNTSGSFNSFFGSEAGTNNNVGSENAFFGQFAGRGNSSGNVNSIFGYSAGAQSNGNINSFFGSLAGQINKADENSFFGAAAGLVNTTGTKNVFLGRDAGVRNDSGSNNSFLGYSAGSTNVAGSSITLVGANADVALDGLTNATAIGAGAVVSTSNTIMLGRNSGLDTVQVPGSLNTANFSANTLTANTVNATTQFNLGGSHFLSTNIFHSTFVGSQAGIRNSNLGFESGGFNTFVGTFAGSSNTTGWANSFVGDTAGETNNTGIQNSYFGSGAGAFGNGNDNSYLGYHAGLDSTGFDNSFFGAFAGSEASGSDNVFFGASAGSNSGNGQGNSFFGTAAGSNSTSSYNSFFGEESGQFNSGGDANAFFGAFTGFFNQGAGNSFFGTYSGENNSTGPANSFFGYTSGQSNSTGDDNSFYGYASGQSNTNGANNSFFGSFAGFANASGNGNTFFGSDAGQATTTGPANSAFGEFAGSDLAYADGYGNVFLGGGAAGAAFNVLNKPPDLSHASSRNTFIGVTSGLGNTTGSNNTLLGSSANVGANNLTFATAIGAGSVVNTSNTITLGRNTGADEVQIPGMVAIGAAAPTSPLTVLGLIETDSPAGGVKFPDGTIQKSAAISGNVVKSLNGLFNDVTLTPGSPNVIITQAGNSISIAAHADATAILNQSAVVQSPATFNIDGTGAANIFNAAAEYDIAGSRVLSEPAGSTNLFAGVGAGATAAPFSSANAFFGFEAGRDNQGSTNTYVGNGAGRMTQFGADNSYFGAAAGSQGGGQRNSFFGALAGLKTNANDNSFFGWHAGEQNLSGAFDAFFGEQAGELNDTGSNNSFFGTNAGEFNKGGSNNTFIGDFAGAANTTQDNNTFVGYFAGATGGTKNSTAIGANAVVFQDNSLVLGSINGFNGATADTKVGIGTPRPTSKLTVVGMIETDSAAGGITFPDGSIQTTAAVGAGGPVVKSLNGLNNDVVLAAGSNITITPAGNTLTIASSGGAIPNAILNQTTQQAAANFNIDGTGTANVLNVATQYNQGGSRLIAEKDTLDGTSNLFAGLNAGASNVFTGFAFGVASTGFNNAYFGFEAGKNVIDGYENSYFGSQAGLGQAGLVGAGYENAAFGSYAGQLLTTGFGNAFFGFGTGDRTTTGYGNAFVGFGTGGNNSSGYENNFMGDNAGGLNNTGFDNVFIGEKAGQQNTSGNNNTVLGANAGMPLGVNNLSFATAIGAGASVDSSNTIVIGRLADTVKIAGMFNPSDIRLKTDVAILNYGLRDLLELRPVTWKWKADANGRTQLGLIAQEVEPIIPELVLRGESKDHLLSMNYVGLLPIVVRAIQEQQATIDELRRQLSQERVIGGPAISKISLESSSPTMSVIDGNITTNDRGEALVEMPAGFQNAHTDFQYQLTVVGQFAQAIVAAEIANNRFSIKTDKPNVKVSWQVTARRNSNVRVEDVAAGGAPEPPIPSATNMELVPSLKSTTPFRDK